MTQAARIRYEAASLAAGLLAAWVVVAVLLPGEVRSDDRGRLLPQLHAGETLRYEVHARLQRHVKTESNVVTLLQPPDLQQEFSTRLLLAVKDVRMESGRQVVVARAELQAEPGDSAVSSAPPSVKVDFTLARDGEIAKVDGLEDLDAEQRLAWQFWLARFAYPWTLPAAGVKPGDKWKSEEQERAPSPIANLAWEHETTYVQDDRCPAIPGETCASFLTQATLKQKSSTKDATPEDYRLHELKTSGTAHGTNEIITYISLRTGLVLRATEDVQQSMDVTIQKADGTNGVHYKMEVISRFETVFVPSKP